MSALPLEALPFLTDVEDGPREILVRHPLEPFQVALLDTLGWSYRVDPSADRCERPCGNSKCARTAAELRAIARLVDEETRRRNLPGIRERVERSIEDGIRVVRDPRDVSLERRPRDDEPADAVVADAPTREEPVETVTRTKKLGAREYVVAEDGEGRLYLVDVACKIEGCEARANATYDRGPYARLCWETHIPAARAEASKRSSAARRRWEKPPPQALAAVPPEPPPAPEPPEPEPEAEASPPALVGVPDPPEQQEKPLDFVDLAFAMHQATAELVEARERYARARQAIVEHPIFRDLYVAVEDGHAVPAWSNEPDAAELPAAR